LQTDIFEAIRNEGTPFEVLRLELRLKSRPKMKKLFEKLGIENDLTFASLFSQRLSQKLLQNQWKTIYDELIPVLLQALDTPEQFELIARQQNKYTPTRVLAMTALCAMIREEGHRKVRGRIKARFSDRTMQRLYKDIKELDFKVLNRAAPFDHITQSLKDFVPLRSEQFSVSLSHTPLTV
jgi:hypothetical protein